ncbi:hypothetical protein VOLCADRAFT_95421, partial [Volvox carteri f. nagariensis]
MSVSRMAAVLQAGMRHGELPIMLFPCVIQAASFPLVPVASTAASSIATAPAPPDTSASGDTVPALGADTARGCSNSLRLDGGCSRVVGFARALSTPQLADKGGVDASSSSTRSSSASKFSSTCTCTSTGTIASAVISPNPGTFGGCGFGYHRPTIATATATATASDSVRSGGSVLPRPVLSSLSEPGPAACALLPALLPTAGTDFTSSLGSIRHQRYRHHVFLAKRKHHHLNHDHDDRNSFQERYHHHRHHQQHKPYLHRHAEAERLTDAQILARLMGYLWPKAADNSEFRRRVVTATGLLVAAKLLNINVPIFLKLAVDALTAAVAGTAAPAAMTVYGMALGPIALLLGWGAARGGMAFCNELRNIVFAKVSQGTIRRVAREVFSHLHTLDLAFHLSKQTGSLSRVVDRGTRGINFILSSM